MYSGSSFCCSSYFDFEKEIKDLCAKHIAKYALPVEYEFRDKLPKTLVGKVAFRELEKEEKEKKNEE